MQVSLPLQSFTWCWCFLGGACPNPDISVSLISFPISSLSYCCLYDIYPWQAAEIFCLEHGFDEALKIVLMPQLVKVRWAPACQLKACPGFRDECCFHRVGPAPWNAGLLESYICVVSIFSSLYLYVIFLWTNLVKVEATPRKNVDHANHNRVALCAQLEECDSASLYLCMVVPRTVRRGTCAYEAREGLLEKKKTRALKL